MAESISPLTIELKPQPKQIPLPRPSELSGPYWEGLRQGELRVQLCDSCGTYVFIPQLLCTNCQSAALSWVTSSGRGTVYSYSIILRPQTPAFETPYVAAIVAMEEGWYTLTNLIGLTSEAVTIGMPVRVHLEQMSDQVTLPYFVPA